MFATFQYNKYKFITHKYKLKIKIYKKPIQVDYDIYLTCNKQNNNKISANTQEIKDECKQKKCILKILFHEKTRTLIFQKIRNDNCINIRCFKKVK